MSRKITLVAVAVALLALPVTPVLADGGAGPAAYARNLSFVGDRLVQLAEAIPEEAYGWRPMEGVRSTSEVIMHVASSAYFFGKRLGTDVPEGVDPSGMEKITAKADVVAALKASLEHLKKAFEGVADPRAETQIFGNPGTVEDMMLVAIGHVHEHFGQLIAYARSNQVVPPWSRKDS